MRGKNRKQANISFTLEELKAADELVKAGVEDNRSDLIRRAFNDWRSMKGGVSSKKQKGPDA
jgi:Arc/MetJ-type ribon-helix-helix transcriptional regulator